MRRFAQYLRSTSHPGSYYATIAWTGSMWRMSTNHSDTVSVYHADIAGSASSAASTPWSGLTGPAPGVSAFANDAGYLPDNGYGTTLTLSNWYRSTGNTGWFNATYSTGIYSDSAGWVKTYNGSNFLSEGALAATGEVYRSYSDKRLKDVIGSIKNALDIVCRWTGVHYTSNARARALGDTNKRVQAGLLVQDVKPDAPELVVLAPMDYAIDPATGGLSSKTGQNYETLIYERTVPYLVEAIKELRAEVAALRAKE